MPWTFCISKQDAKFLWCPFARSMTAIEPEQVGSNRHVEDEFDRNGNQKTSPQVGCRCLADGCMAWRWVETNINDGKGGPMEPSGDTHGYCGLAGIPSRVTKGHGPGDHE